MKDIIKFSPSAVRDDRHMQEMFRLSAEKALRRIIDRQERIYAKKLKSTVTLENIAEMAQRGDADAGYENLEGSELSLQRQYREGIVKELVKFFKNMHIDTKFDLKWKEFMCITFCLQFSFPYILRHIDVVYKWGAFLVLAVSFMLNACMAMPVYMILMFMGNYSRKSYIRFWECVPMLKGVAYSVAITTVLQEIFNVAFASLALKYLIDILSCREYPWKECKFRGSSSDCYYSTSTGYNASCCRMNQQNCSINTWSRTVFKFAAYDYFKQSQLEVGYTYSTKNTMAPIFLFLVVFIWVVIFLMMMVGLKKFRGVMTTINLIILVVIFVPFWVLTLYYSNTEMFIDLKSNYFTLFNYNLWVEVAMHSLHRELAGDVITFSAISSPGISSSVDTLCIYTLKFLYFTWITVWVSIGATMLKKYYNIINTKCIYIDGFMVMYGLFPDILSRLRFGKAFLILYFAILFYWSFSASVYTLNSLTSAIFEAYPKLVKFKLLVCAAFCIIICGVNLFVMQKNLEVLYRKWITDTYIQMKVILLFFTLQGIYIYSVKRIMDDYHFTYGQKLNIFWIYGLKVATLLVWILTIFKFVTYCFTATRNISDIVIILSILLPVLYGVSVKIFQYRTHKTRALLSPEPQWGPPDPMTKLARSKFDPRRAFRYKSTTQNCKHSCLLQSSELESEIERWKKKCFTQYGTTVE